MLALNLKDLPEIKFAEKDVNEIINRMISDFEQAYYESTGERKKLRSGDPVRIFLYSQAFRELQLRYLIDDAAKQNLLAYSRGDNLEHLGVLTQTDRFQATAATVQQKFTLSEAQDIDKTLPEGTRVSPDRDIYFATTEDHVVSAGDTEITVEVECTEKGTIGNDFTPGQIDIIVDPQPWLESTTNTETSSGGSDKEDDDDYRERIHLAPESFSVAGPVGAYEYLTYQFDSDIIDVYVTSPNPGEVDVYALLTDGELPQQSFLDDLKEYLSAKDKRPLTDNVSTEAPNTTLYNLDLTYYIREEDSVREQEIKDAVEEAINNYETWQRSEMGRDINPSELVFRCVEAGAKRVEVTEPSSTAVSDNTIAVVDTKSVTYGGLE